MTAKAMRPLLGWGIGAAALIWLVVFGGPIAIDDPPRYLYEAEALSMRDHIFEQPVADATEIVRKHFGEFDFDKILELLKTDGFTVRQLVRNRTFTMRSGRSFSVFAIADRERRVVRLSRPFRHIDNIFAGIDDENSVVVFHYQ